MISALLAFASAVPQLLNLVGMIMSLFHPTEAQIQEYQDLIKAQADQGNLSVDESDRLDNHMAAIKARQAHMAKVADRNQQRG